MKKIIKKSFICLAIIAVFINIVLPISAYADTENDYDYVPPADNIGSVKDVMGNEARANLAIYILANCFAHGINKHENWDDIQKPSVIFDVGVSGDNWDGSDRRVDVGYWMEEKLTGSSSDGRVWCSEKVGDGHSIFTETADALGITKKELFCDVDDSGRVVGDGIFYAKDGKECGDTGSSTEYTRNGNGGGDGGDQLDADNIRNYSWGKHIEKLYNAAKERNGWDTSFDTVQTYTFPKVNGYYLYTKELISHCGSHEDYDDKSESSMELNNVTQDGDQAPNGAQAAKVVYTHFSSDEEFDHTFVSRFNDNDSTCSDIIARANEDDLYGAFRRRMMATLNTLCKKSVDNRIAGYNGNVPDETQTAYNSAVANTSMFPIGQFITAKDGGAITDETTGWICSDIGDIAGAGQEDSEIDKEDEEVASDDCYTNAASLGWILCPIINQGGDFVTTIYEKMIEPFLVLDSGLFDTKQVGGQATYEAWTQFQTYANIVFIAIFLVVIFSQLTGYGIDNYGIKKILPKLIVAALMINLSYIICQLAVDIANIAGYGMKSILGRIGSTLNIGDMSTIEAPGAKPAVATGILVGLVALLVVPALLSQGTAILVPVFIAIISIVIAVFTLFCILAIRKAFAVVLVVISPMAFVCYMLPNTKKLFDKWFTAFKATLIAFPICSGMVYGGQAVARILVQASGGTNMPFLVVLSAAVMSIAPVFLIPSTLKKSMGAISGLVDRASGRVGHFAKGRAMNSRGARYLQKHGEQRMMARQGEYNRKKASKALYKGSLAGRALQGVTRGKYQAGLANKAKLNTAQRRAYNAALGALSMEDQSQIDTHTARFKALGDDDAIISQVQAAAAKGRLDSNMMAAAVNAIHDENKIADVMKAADNGDAMSKLIAGSDPNSVNNRQKISSALAGRSGNIIAQSMGKLVNEGKSYGQMTSNGANSDLAKKVQSAGTSVMASQDKDVFDMAGAADYFSAEQKAAGVSAGYSGSTADKFNNMLSGMSQSQKDAVLNEMTSGEQWAKSTGAALNALGGEDAIDRVSGSNDAVKQAVSNFANSPELHANADAAVMGALKINPDEIKQQAQQAQANAIKGAIKESQDAQLKREINANLSGLSAEEKSKLFYNNPKQAGESNEDYMYRVSRDYRDGKAK